MATAESVKGKIQGLISQANGVTGKTDADLTTAIGSLIAGFGQGGGVFSQITLAIPFTNAITAGTELAKFTDKDYTMFVFNGDTKAENQLLYCMVRKEPLSIGGCPPSHMLCAVRYRGGIPAVMGGIAESYDLVGNVGDSYLMLGGNAL